MKNNFVVVANQWWLAILWWLSMATAQAQTAQPPLIQWQRVMPGNAEFVTPAYVVKATDGALGVITAKHELLKLSASGETLWTSPIPAQNAGSGLVAQSPAGLVPTPDGGFVVLARDIIGWYITKFNATGGRIWVKKIVDDYGYSLGYSEDKLIQTRDGGFLLTGTRGIKQSKRGTFITKVDQAGNLTWETELNYPFNLSAGDGSATVASGALSLPDGGYLLVGLTQTFSGNTTYSSWAAKLDNLGQLIWQNKYDSQALLEDVVLSPFGDGSYLAAGSVTNSENNSASHTELLTIQADGTLGGRSSIDGSRPANLVGFKVSIVAASPTEGGPSYTIFDTDKQNQGDFRLTNVGPNHQVQWTKRLGGSSAEIAQSIVATDNGYAAVGYSNSMDGDLTGQTNQLGGGPGSFGWFSHPCLPCRLQLILVRRVPSPSIRVGAMDQPLPTWHRASAVPRSPATWAPLSRAYAMIRSRLRLPLPRADIQSATRLIWPLTVPTHQ